ncbi:hypothetical protein SRS16CHR_03941 [Variovorax sp. SRS16]|uniref:hypothetical protein n=1 Tax=Variovorax sp. SRS16 TaxID=282217 RepID=UPI001318C88A|nr:hypothetical protein [Variovorax sp. SRS16]VTU26843.1 hypothetical protein SRS16CHR_03941 [Variovorax sp. SRS16]
MGLRRAALCVACLASIAGCEQAGTSASLFPLDAGHRWTYRVITQAEDGTTERETLVMRTLGAESDPAIEGGSAWRRRSDSGVDYWLRSDSTGIYRVASKSDLDPAPKPDKPLRFVLRAPFVRGTQWRAGTVPYLLMRRNEFPREVRYTHPDVPMNFQIEAEDDVVDVPAGHFDRCLRVKGTATLRLYADPVRGWRDMPLSTTEWYCAGVGLVRVERTEPAERLAYLTGGTRTLELVSWQ